MGKQDLVGKIATSIALAKRPSKFTCEGVIEADVGLTVEEYGEVQLPLRPAAGRKLAGVASQAPYGKRTETIRDTTVRDTLEIAANSVCFSDSFMRAIDIAAGQVADSLRLDSDRIEVELYKLLIYLKGGFFLPHRDNEKRRGMVATMIVVLPSVFGGGELIVKHKGDCQRYSFDAVRKPVAGVHSRSQYAAFFADCQHEVKKVTSGVRVCAAFNLILKPMRSSSTRLRAGGDPRLLRAVKDWMRTRASDPLLFALEHQYTQSGLKPGLLKGADKELHSQLMATAEAIDCRLYFGQVSRHLSQFADDGSFGRGRRGWSGNYDDLELGEVYEDEIIVDGWKDAAGKRISMGDLGCESSQLICATPIKDWIPTQQDYEGYTGNAGNSLDRWYHKSALLMWPNSMHFDVIAQMGMQYATERLLSMRKELKKGGEPEQQRANNDCRALAEAIIRRWPERLHEPYGAARVSHPWLAAFARDLPKVDDPTLVVEFLRTLAKRDWLLNLDRLVVASIKRMGADTLIPHLENLIEFEPQPNKYGRRVVEGLAHRDAAWLRRICEGAESLSVPPEAIRRLLDLAISKIERHAIRLDESRNVRNNAPTSTWLLLCQAAIAADAASQLGRLLALTEACPRVFDLDEFQVAAAKKLRDWADARDATRPIGLESWIESLRDRLRSKTMTPPVPPKDFRRDSETGCDCALCKQLRAFLDDPTLETGGIPAREDLRDHLEAVISRKRLDVTTKLDKSCRPYALSLTKNSDSYKRDVEQYHRKRDLLASLS